MNDCVFFPTNCEIVTSDRLEDAVTQIQYEGLVGGVAVVIVAKKIQYPTATKPPAASCSSTKEPKKKGKRKAKNN
jgi:hypothetical protein